MATGDLTTIAAVKAVAPIASSTTASDPVLQGYISACSADFMRATHRPDLLTASYTEVRVGDGSDRLCAYHWPLTAISSLTIGGATVNASADQIAAGYYFDAEAIDPERQFNLYLAGGLVFTDRAVVKFSYTAGYVAIPFDIAQAVIDWVIYRYKQEPNIGANQRRSTEGEQVQQSQLDAPATTKACIERYMRRIPSVSRRYDEEQNWMKVRAPRGARGQR